VFGGLARSLAAPQATISSDGQTVFAVTGIGRLLKINVNDGSQIELIGHTPYLNLDERRLATFRLKEASLALADHYP